jgi:Flp pilus assembly protein TadG
MRQMPTIRQNLTRRGAVIVEMALVLPIFLALVLGIIEFGRGLMVAQLVTNAAREGARKAILDGSTNSDITSTIQSLLATSANVSTGNITVTITVTPASGNPDPGNDIAACKSKDLITIKVQVPFDKVALLAGKYLNGKLLTGQAAMRHE